MARARRLWPVYRGLPCAREPDGEALLAARVVEDALRLAALGDEAEREWVTSPSSVDPWARRLGVTGDRLASLARAALRQGYRKQVPDGDG